MPSMPRERTTVVGLTVMTVDEPSVAPPPPPAASSLVLAIWQVKTPIVTKYCVTCASSVSPSPLQPLRLFSGALPSSDAISDPSVVIATTPSTPRHETCEPWSIRIGVEPNAKRDFVTSYVAPRSGCPAAHPAVAPAPDVVADVPEGSLDALQPRWAAPTTKNTAMARRSRSARE